MEQYLAKQFPRETLAGNPDASDSDSDDDLPGGFTVLVQEVACNIPDCAPLEVVVALLKKGLNKSGKILKPAVEVKDEDVELMLCEIFENASGREQNKSAASGVNSSKGQDHPFMCPCCNPDVTKFDKVSQDVFTLVIDSLEFHLLLMVVLRLETCSPLTFPRAHACSFFLLFGRCWFLAQV